MTKTEAVWIQNLKAFITTGLFREDERWKKIFIEQLNRINEATTPAAISSEPTQEFTLRAMAHNYSGGHSWDHLDGEACLKAADEIRGLRAYLSALAPQAGDNAEEPVAFTSRTQLDELKANPGHIMSMWSKGLLPPHEEIPLYTHPCTSTSVVSQNAPALEDKGGGSFEARVFEILTHGYPAPFAKVDKLAKRIADLRNDGAK